MSRRLKFYACVLLAMALCSLMPAAWCYGTGVKTYLPSQRSVTADTFPFSYNGSFMVYNDGYREGVYVIRVSVTDQASINWLDLSSAMFTLKPGESKLVQFTLNVTGEAPADDYDFTFMPARLTTSVEPYMDQFANYISKADPFTFTLTVKGEAEASSSNVSAGTPIVFLNESNRTNLVQSSVLENSYNVVTQLDRAIKLNVPSGGVVGEPVSLSTSVFEGLSGPDISLLVVSPDSAVYPASGGNYTFNEAGLWGVVVLVGDDIIMGKTVDVASGRSPLAGIDAGTVLAGLSLLILLSVVPVWLMAPRRPLADPYSDIVYKAYVIRKYIDKFDRDRLQRAVNMLREEYDGLVSKKAAGSRREAYRSIDELGTLASLEY